MRLTQGAILCLCLPALFLDGCTVGTNHTSDAALERVFNHSQAEFEVLLAEVQADSQLTTLQRNTVIYAGRLVNVDESDLSEVEHLGLSKDTWKRYQKQLRELGLYGVLKSESRVEFRLDPGSIRNGDSYKGYEYRQTPPEHVRTSLDGYRVFDGDKDRFGGWSVYKPLKANWYLYLFVNK